MNNKIAVVTGASKGIGKAVAEALLEKGYVVIANSRSLINLQEQLPEESDNLFFVAGDITEEQTRADIYSKITDVSTKLDVLINNAPGAEPKPFESLTHADFIIAYEEKLLAYLLNIQTFLPLLKKSGCGRVISIAGTLGTEPEPSMFLNGLINAAIANANKALAAEYAKDKITFNCINPGNINTDRYQAVLSGLSQRLEADVDEVEAAVLSNIPLRRPGTVREISSLAAYLCSADASFITGQQINIDGGKIKSI
ncbi:bacilysin biosynthesis oxidoreductase BacG [Evansella caseinilytica]|uniref:Bacilysin biosynthesis oxidoreductase BacG n=1 Tax=Evansella caseinilytica TaxID=1503961 RepID=A0A1H3G556_9BACI|nr:SDR family oxidoreductase [Evansella caseinilytica]SDX97818.1 bacilysin biosynthesis oxidoreductase BacG [Evansella caseinilytica]